MSQRSLLIATRDFLIKNMPFNNRPLTLTTCNVMIDERPPAVTDTFFISVHPGGFRGTSTEVLDITHQIKVTISMKTGEVPQDRLGPNRLVPVEIGLEELVQTIIANIHNNYLIIQAADELIDKGLNRWVEPLRFSSSSPPRVVTNDWFQASNTKGANNEAGIVQTIIFGDARRVQYGSYQPVWFNTNIDNSKIQTPNPGVIDNFDTLSNVEPDSIGA